MADQDDSDKTEEATPLRREEFRKRGQVAQTRELASVLLIFSLILCFYLLGKFTFDQIHILFQEVLGKGLLKTVRHDTPLDVAKFSLFKVVVILAPVLFLCLCASFMSSVFQIGILNNEEALGLKWERLDPVSGFQRIFSIRSLVEGFKSVVKITLIGGVTYLVLKNEIHAIPFLINYSVADIMGYIGVVLLKLLTAVVAFMAGVAGLDYMFQRWELEKSMMMTRQEVKEEMKSREGDPMVRARIRRSQREMAQKRMMTEVPKADVVITNPTHISVAIKYDMKTMAAPRIVAMGAGYIAEKIRDIARQNNIPLVENKPLARTIFKTLKIGQHIPRELYTAVAEVLSYVFKLKKKGLN